MPELVVAGKPVKIEKVDEVTVRYVSENPYYTLPIKLSSTSNLGGHGRWGYVGLGGFAPAHYLKQFHPKYAGQEAVEAMAKEAGFDNWVLFFQERNSSYRNVDLPVITAWKTVQADHRRRVGIRAQPLQHLDGRGGQPAPLYRPDQC